MGDTDPYAAIFHGFGEGIGKSLVGGVREWAVGRWQAMKRFIRSATPTECDNLSHLVTLIQNQRIVDGDLVALECRPSSFGPFLRDLFLPIAALNPGHYIGPRADLQFPLNQIAHLASMLMPVGLYPSPGDGATQGYLYPAGVPCCGVLGLPGLTPEVPRVPAIFSTVHQPALGRRCRIKGLIRFASPDLMQAAGCKPERYEEMRQAGDIWFFDATGEESTCEALSEEVQPLWGGLYATGHIEIVDGGIRRDELGHAIFTAMRELGHEATSPSPNYAGRQERVISAPGIRAAVDGQLPVFSFHMDAQLTKDLPKQRADFDAVCHRSIELMTQACEGKGRLLNPMDLDFTYTDSDKAHSVMKSLSAEQIADPLALTIREWNRRRGNDGKSN